jgi:hypothetical protein
MNREQIIKDILSLKDTAINHGFDWPTDDDGRHGDPENASTIQLDFFLKELREFFLDEGI